MNKSTEIMPALFIGHGSPMNALETNEFTLMWQKIANEIPKPKAILAISAHWETRGTRTTIMPQPKTIHDFGGFPKALYDVQYPAAGLPALAQSLINTNTQISPDTEWGLDHGTWSILKHIYPKANIPVIQMSLDYHKSPKEHYELAKEIAHLRKDGVLILGSGNIVHNLRQVAWNKINEPEFGYGWALEANDKIKNLISQNKTEALFDYQKLGLEVQMAIPTPEHFLPLLYILSLQTPEERATFFNDKAVMGSLTMTSFIIDSINKQQ